MGSRRTLILIAAILVAGLAAVATFSYLDGVQERANKGARLVKVFVVKKDVAKGLPGDQAIEEGFVATDSIPEKVRPTNAIVDINTIRGKIALQNMSKNQVVVDGQFVDQRSGQVTFAQRIPSGQVAITVSVDSVRGVAGLLVPGDKVNILVSDQGAQRFLFQNVNVIAIGSNQAPQPGETTAPVNPGSGLITFAVPPLAAEKIAFAAGGEESGLYLTLVPPDFTPVAVEPVNNDNLFTGGLTPYEG